MKDIKAVTQDKALAFYERFYAPNNAVLVIAGSHRADRDAGADRAPYGGIAPAPRRRPPIACSPSAPRPRRCAPR